MKYNVRLYRSVGQVMRLEVEADDESQACARGLAAARAGRGEWEDVTCEPAEAEADEVESP